MSEFLEGIVSGVKMNIIEIKAKIKDSNENRKKALEIRRKQIFSEKSFSAGIAFGYYSMQIAEVGIVAYGLYEVINSLK